MRESHAKCVRLGRSAFVVADCGVHSNLVMVPVSTGYFILVNYGKVLCKVQWPVL